MKRFVLGVLCFTLLTSGLFSANTVKMVSKLASNPLVSSLVTGLGFNSTQAVGGAGTLLGMAQQSLPKADWDKIAKAIPGTKDLISTAKALGGISKFGNLASMTSAFTKMGLNQDQVGKMVPSVNDFVGKAAGPDVGKLFADAIK